ncbi:hypothetical protein ACFZC7_04275 [Streptomyces massasporeus]|uniref:hypothetical protein n=1 Tax=Streptomyces massasporeus TaxID=67324 RepID=UPI0036EAB871
MVDDRARPGETGEVELYLGDELPPRVDEVGGRRYFFVGLLCGADGVLEFVAQLGVGGGLLPRP